MFPRMYFHNAIFYPMSVSSKLFQVAGAVKA